MSVRRTGDGAVDCSEKHRVQGSLSAVQCSRKSSSSWVVCSKISKSERVSDEEDLVE